MTSTPVASTVPPFKKRSVLRLRPAVILVSALSIVSACGGDEGDEVRCGPGTIERSGQCLVASSGSSSSDDSSGDAGSQERAGASGAGAGAGGAPSSPSAGKGGQLAAGGASNTNGGANPSGGPSEADAGAPTSAGNAGDSAGGGANGCEVIGENAGEGNLPDLGESPTACTTGPIHCTPEQELPSSGGWPITRTDAITALSDTTVVFGNQDRNTLDVLDLCTGKIRWWWQLPSAPGAAVLDRAHRVLYVSLRGATSVAKVSLDRACIELIAVPSPAVALTLGAGTMLFARLDDTQPGTYNKPISIIDTATNRVLATRRGEFDKFIAFRRAGNRLFAGSIYGGVQAFEYDPQTLQFTKAEASADTSDPCFELQLSPDQTHLFFACSNGVSPTPLAQGADFNPADLASPFGVYENGLSAVAMAYSPGGGQLFTMTGSQVVAFDVATRARIGTYAIPAAVRLSVAPSGRVIVGGGYRSVTSGTAMLNWARVDVADCRP